MKNLSPLAEELIERYRDRYRSFQPKEGNTIRTDKKGGGATSFCEKARAKMNSKQKHLFRKRLIFEILRGKLIINKENEIAEFLIKELIRRGRLTNNFVTQPKMREVQEVIDKYVFIMGHTSEGGEGRGKKELQQWLLHITAWEIEETLVPHEEKILVEYLGKITAEKYKARGTAEQEKNIQSFITSQRSLLDSNQHLLAYYLLTKKFPHWKNPSQEQLVNITTDIYSIWKNIRRNLKNALQRRLQKTTGKLTPSFLVLGKILEEESDPETFKNPKWLEKRIKEVYQRTSEKLKKDLFRATMVFSLIIFLLKLLLLFTVEIPFAEFPLTASTVAVSTLTPALLIIFLGLSIGPPRDGNLNLVFLETMEIIYGEEDSSREIEKTPSSLLNKSLMSFYYLLTFSLFTGMIVLGLSRLNFPLLSQIIFLVFISLVSFLLLRMRKEIEKLKVNEEESLIRDVLKSFSWPLEKLIKDNPSLISFEALIKASPEKI